MELVAQSEIPEFCHIGNLITEKRYEEAIQLGKKLLSESDSQQDLSMIHINLITAYEKLKMYKEASEHMKYAILTGHNTGLAYERMAITLERAHYFHQALEICNLVLDDRFRISLTAGEKERKLKFANRKERLMKRLQKSEDADTDFVFTPEQKEHILHMTSELRRIEEESSNDYLEYSRKSKDIGYFTDEADKLWEDYKERERQREIYKKELIAML